MKYNCLKFKFLNISNSLKIFFRSRGSQHQGANFKFQISSLLVLIFVFFVLSSQTASAFTMSNLDFILQMGNLNSFSGSKSNGEFTLNDTGGQLAPGLYSGPNFKIRAGFQYISSIIRFRFSISSQLIDFGVVSPTNPVTRTNELTVSNASAYGYQVTAFEDHQLLVPVSGAIIPNTSCDAGTCTTTTSAAWTSTLAYGFGYRCDNVSATDCASGFSDPTYYKQFPDESASQTPQAVMAGTNAGVNKKVQITYKVNISGTQVAGSYRNRVIYIATPTF